MVMENTKLLDKDLIMDNLETDSMKARDCSNGEMTFTIKDNIKQV